MAGWKSKLDYVYKKLETYNKCWTLFVIIQFTMLNLGICFSTFQDYKLNFMGTVRVKQTHINEHGI